MAKVEIFRPKILLVTLNWDLKKSIKYHCSKMWLQAMYKVLMALKKVEALN